MLQFPLFNSLDPFFLFFLSFSFCSFFDLEGVIWFWILLGTRGGHGRRGRNARDCDGRYNNIYYFSILFYLVFYLCTLHAVYITEHKSYICIVSEHSMLVFYREAEKAQEYSFLLILAYEERKKTNIAAEIDWTALFLIQSKG